MDQQQQQKEQIKYRKVRLDESNLIARFQYDMAKETEGKELIQEEVKKAVDFMYNNPNRGFYLVGSTTDEENKAISSELITFGYDIFRATHLWWFQSVFVEKSHRGQGIFKGMFHEVERINQNQKYPLRLYVELENTRAQQVYQRLGMFDTNEVFIEDDFYFDDKIKFEDSGLFSFNLANKEQTEQFKEYLKIENNLISLMNKEISSLDKTLELIDHIQNISNYQHIFVITEKSTNKIIGYLPVFYEYSDWRNGNMVYIYDVRIIKDLLDSLNQSQLIQSFMYFLKHTFKPADILTNIRWIIQENCQFKDTLISNGLELAHYRVYEKNQF